MGNKTTANFTVVFVGGHFVIRAESALAYCEARKVAEQLAVQIKAYTCNRDGVVHMVAA